MRYYSLSRYNDVVLLIARLLMMLLFLIFGWQKLIAFGPSVDYMTAAGAPLPLLSAIIAVVMELGAGALIALGFYTRPLALLMALYTLGTALIAHHYWTMSGMEQYANMINFYKNISIIGGLLLLALTGPGKFSLDRR